MWVAGIRNAAALVAGPSHTCAVLRNGSAACWGSNMLGKLGSTAPGQPAAPENRSSPGLVTGLPALLVPDLPSSSADMPSVIAAGAGHTCVVTADRRVFCFGEPSAARGDTSWTAGPPAPPGPVAGVANVQALSAGYGHTCTVASGAVTCWGRAPFGLGDGGGPQAVLPWQTTTVYRGPTSSNDVAAVAAGMGHTCALTAGEPFGVRCWGWGAFSQLGATPEGALPPFYVPAPPPDMLNICWL